MSYDFYALLNTTSLNITILPHTPHLTVIVRTSLTSEVLSPHIKVSKQEMNNFKTLIKKNGTREANLKRVNG